MPITKIKKPVSMATECAIYGRSQEFLPHTTTKAEVGGSSTVRQGERNGTA